MNSYPREDDKNGCSILDQLDCSPGHSCLPLSSPDIQICIFSDTHQKSNSLKTCNSKVLYAIILIILMAEKQNSRVSAWRC